MSIWLNLKNNLAKGAKFAGQKSGEFSKKSKSKLNELGIKKEIEEKFIDLGGLVYQKAINKGTLNFEKDLIIKHIIEQIKELEQELSQLEKDK